MAPVLVFGPTGQTGSIAALTAAKKGATVHLAMRDPKKPIPGLTPELEKFGQFQRIQADLQDPESISQAVKTSGAKRAFIYLIHGAADHQKSAVQALKDAGVEFVVFLSSFTIPTDKGFREVPAKDVIPFLHAQVEANLDDVFGPDNYVALRPGAFVSNLVREKAGILANRVEQFGGGFEQDNISPSDIGRVAGEILVSGAKSGQKKVYLYGPEVMPMREGVVRIGKALGRDVEVTKLGPEEGFEKYIKLGMPPVFAKYMVEVLSTSGPDKGNGERFPRYEEGVKNVELYTGKPAMSIEDWVEENRSIFRA